MCSAGQSKPQDLPVSGDGKTDDPLDGKTSRASCKEGEIAILHTFISNDPWIHSPQAQCLDKWVGSGRGWLTGRPSWHLPLSPAASIFPWHLQQCDSPSPVKDCPDCSEEQRSLCSAGAVSSPQGHWSVRAEGVDRR